jgi:DNA-binding LacI/PurR family transcriptional regulator
MRPTLKDIAEKAGVSIKTVSNVANGTGVVSKEMKERVEKILIEENYRANFTAQQLKLGRSGEVVLALPSVVNNYFAELAQVMIQHAKKYKIKLVLEMTDGLHSSELSLIKDLNNGSIDGLILSPLSLTEGDLRQLNEFSNLVLLGEHLKVMGRVSVGINDEKASYEVVSYLHKWRRSNIAIIGKREGVGSESSKHRLKGSLDAIKSLNSKNINKNFIQTVASFSSDEGYSAMSKLLLQNSRPNAIFCFSDLLAFGAMKAIMDSGYSIPEDFVVFGFDDLETSKFTRPSLSSVSPDKVQIAKKTLEIIERGVAGERPGKYWHEVPYQIIERESTNLLNSNRK